MRAAGLLSYCALVGAALVAGCASTREETLLTGETMGSTWTVKLAGPLLATETALRAGVQQRFDAVVAQMSTFEPQSDLSRFNQGSGDWQTLPPDLLVVMGRALQIAAQSDGAYDITVGPLVNLWGFGPGAKPDTLRQPPEQRAIDAARAHVGWHNVEMDAAAGRARKPTGVYVDLSSLAKGFGVDQAAAWLRSQGVRDFLIDLSGKLRAGGVNARGEPWRVAVERPGADDPTGAASVTPAAVTLSDRAIATAGNYRHHFVAGGRNYSHLIDPRSGWPIDHAGLSVTVVAADCLDADALATALLVMTPQAALQLAESQQIAALFITQDGSTQRLTTSSAWKANVDTR